MAFAKQYFSSYKSNNDLDYYLEIWVDGYTGGNPSEISIGAGGPVITYETDQEDRFSPILSSQCVLPFIVKGLGTQSFIQSLRTTYQERQVYLHLYRANSSGYSSVKPIWSGFLVMDLGSGEDVSFPYEQKLTFVDGLSLLKDIDFVDLSNSGSETNIMGSYTQENMYFGPATYIFWIREILNKVGFATTNRGVSIDWGFTTAINWYNGTMTSTSQSSDPMALTKCIVSMFHTKNDQDVYTPENCYTVLKQLLRHWGARITYWKHELWIVQIPEYIEDEAGFIDNPNNINSRQYNRFGAYQGSQDHLGDTYYTRYEQTIASNQVSKLVGTKYNYLPIIHRVSADFLSFASKNYYGGFPFGTNATSQEIFQGTIVDPSSANFIWLSIPLNWVWDMSQAGSTNVNLSNGHTNGWWCSVKFNFYASDGTTTYYLQYNSSNGSFYWVLAADWSPLGNRSPRYVVKSRNLTETNYIGFQEQLAFVDSSGNAITMNGAWSFFLDIEDYGTSSANAGSFYCNFSGYNNPAKMRNPNTNITIVSPLGVPIKSGTVSWSNTLQDPSAITVPSTILNPAGFNAGTNQDDIRLVTQSSFKGFLQTLSTTQNASFGQTVNTQINGTTNSEVYSFGTLLWGDAIQQFAVGSLMVNNGNGFVKTNPNGTWGRGTLSGTQTFTELLIDEFITGQVKVAIAPTMRLAVGDLNKNQTATGQSGSATRPRYVNPIGRLRESRSNQTDPEYIFRRGSFYTLYDEWDYEGYQILRDTSTTTTTTTDLGGLGGGQVDMPLGNAKVQGPVTNALMMNSPVAYTRAAIPATGSDVVVNGNFNVATGWTLGTGWSIDTTAKKAKFTATGSASTLEQSVLTTELTYQINFTVEVTAGTLYAKAGFSGTQTITTSGTYTIFLNSEGTTGLKFEAGTTFTGTITHITARDQKSLSSLPINVIGNTVFKTGDTFNLVNSIGDEIIPLTVTSNQGASDDTISVTAVPLYDDIAENSVLLINQDDLSEQYQNKTKGTVAGFAIDADGIAKGGVEITGWLDSDTMSGATANNVPTAESVKAYVDAQVGSADTLQEVTDNGNTTTNSITFAGGTSTGDITGQSITLGDGSTAEKLRVYYSDNTYVNLQGYGLEMSRHTSYIRPTVTNTNGLRIGNHSLNWSYISNYAIKHYWYNASSELMRLTSGGNLLVGQTSNTGEKLQVNGNQRINAGELFITEDGSARKPVRLYKSGYKGAIILERDGVGTVRITGAAEIGHTYFNATNVNVGIGNNSPLAKLHITTGSSGVSSIDAGTSTLIESNTTNYLRFANPDANIGGLVWTSPSDNFGAFVRWGHDTGLLEIATANSSDSITFATANADEKMRLTSGGNLLIGTTTDDGTNKLQVNGDARINGSNLWVGGGDDNAKPRIRLHPTNGGQYIDFDGTTAQLNLRCDTTIYFTLNATQTSIYNALSGTTATFSGQVTIPATPVAATDAASKSYVDAQVGSADTLQEVTDNGNTTSQPIRLLNATNVNSKFESNTNLYLNADYDSNSGDAYRNIIFENRGSEKMRLTSDGKLGLGVTSPDVQFHASGDVKFTNAYVLDSIKHSGDSDTQIAFDTDTIKFDTFGYERMRLNSNGQLSIGSTGGGYKLLVSGTGWGGNGIAIQSTTTNGAVLSLINTQKNFQIASRGSTLDFRDVSDNDTRRFYIDSTGDAYFAKELVANETIKANQIANDNYAFYATNSSGSNRGGLYLDAGGDTELKLRTGSGDIVSLKADGNSFINGGNLGIGTSSPSEKLDVNGNLRIGDGGTGSSLNFNSTDRGTIKINGSEKARITSGGNLLIGTTSDDGSSKLQVAGKTLINANANSGHLTVNNSANSVAEITSTNTYLSLNAANYIILNKTTLSYHGLWFLNNKPLRYKETDDSWFDVLNVSGTDNLIKFGSVGDVSTGGDIAFYHDSSEKMRLTTTGLGIGTSSPSEPLEVVGTARMDNSIVEGTLFAGSSVQHWGNNGTGMYFNTDIVTIQTASTERMRITSGGNFGIGTSNPLTKLQINDGTNINLKIGESSGEIQIKSTNDADTAYTPLIFRANKYSILNGNVGIGTTSPSEKLHIAGGGSGNLRLDSGGTYYGTYLQAISSLGIKIGNDDYSAFTQIHNDGYQLWSMGGSEKMRLDSSGRLLLNATSTSFNDYLYISGDAYSTGGFRIGTSSTYVGKMYNNAGKLTIESDGDRDIQFQSGNNASIMYIDTSTQKIGIGTTSPIYPLDVNGNIRATAYRIGGGTILSGDSTVNLGSAGATGFITFTTTSGEGMRLSGSNVLIGTTSDVGAKLYVNGVIRAVGGGIQAAQDYGFTLNDEAGNNRYGLKFGAAGTVGGSNLLMLTNRSLHSATGGGMVTIGGNNSTSGVSEVEIARFDPRVAATSGNQKKVTLDAVLELTQQTAPANPATGKSIIWMDSSDGAIKVKINYGGTVVTRTIALFSD